MAAFGIIACLAAAAFSVLALPASAAPLPRDEALIEGFQRIVFGAEIPGFFGGGQYLKRFAGPVRFHIANLAQKNRTPEARAFLSGLGRQIRGLDSGIAAGPRDANFVVHVVDRRDYQRVGREIYRNPFFDIPGNCIVRSNFSRRGIERSDALIVSDEGEKLFTRCLIEEVLQGLGPLNDNADAPDSVFNDTSLLTRFTRYDRIMLNVLYDDRLSPGMAAETARPLLEEIVPEVRRRVR